MKQSEITIYTSRNEPRCTIGINIGAKGKFTLGSEDYITLPFSSVSPISFEVGDWCDLRTVYDTSEEDTDGMRDKFAKVYKVISTQTPTYNVSTGGYDYQLRMDAYYYEWQNKLFLYMPKSGAREVSWSLTSPLETHLNCLVENINSVGFRYKEEDGTELLFEYEIHDVGDAAKTISYSQTSIINAIIQMAETWECEWWVEKNKIHFGKKETVIDNPITMKNGESCESITRSDSMGTYATRVYVFGSDRNIPPTYRQSLVFNVSNVTTASDGRVIISDSARPLKKDYFPDNVKSYNDTAKGRLSFAITSVGYSYPPQKCEFKSNEITLDAGLYTITDNVSAFSVKSGNDILSWDFVLWLVIDGQRNMLAQAGAYNGYNIGNMRDVNFGTWSKEFILQQSSSVSMVLEMRMNKNNVSDIPGDKRLLFIAQYNMLAKDGIAKIDTSISLMNEDETFGEPITAVVNPNFVKEEVNKIYLPQGTQIAVGDKFIINNIVSNSVPLSFWSATFTNADYTNGIVQRRLMLPKEYKYLDAYRYYNGKRYFIGTEEYSQGEPMSDSEAIDGVITNEDIYPKTDLEIKEVRTYESEKQEDGKGTGVYETFYYCSVKNEFPFEKRYIIKDKELGMVFTSGRLNGMTFGCTFREAGETFKKSKLTENFYELVANEDYGRKLPDDILKPMVGNTFALTGWNSEYLQDLDLLANAENELLAYGEEQLKKMYVDDGTYTCNMMSYLAEQDKRFMPSLGDQVNLSCESYFSGLRKSRIIGYEINLDIPYDTSSFVCGESIEYSRIKAIEAKISETSVTGASYISNSYGGDTDVALTKDEILSITQMNNDYEQT